MASREEFLREVRLALDREQAAQGRGANPADDGSAGAALVKGWEVRERLDGERPAALARLEKTAERQGWHLLKVPSYDAAVAAVVSLAQSLKARRVVRTAEPLFERVRVDEALASAGVEVTTLAWREDDPQRTREALRQAAIQADMGITGVDYVVAETATAVLVPGPGKSRLASLVPPVHVAIVDVGQLLLSLDELFVLRKVEAVRGNLGSYMSFITGPSRTGDIEQTIVVGAHGPREAHMVLIAP
jgi:L-lactate dehydrogenase complex protein LldG